jgi:hypothetical protein
MPGQSAAAPGAGRHRCSPRRGGSVRGVALPRNLTAALGRVEQNAGAAGIGGMSTEELRPWLRDHWPEVRARLEAGTTPQPVRRVTIPKPSGGGPTLGVPTAVDRLTARPSRRCSHPSSTHTSRALASASSRDARPIKRRPRLAGTSRRGTRGCVTSIWMRSLTGRARRADGHGGKTGP